MKLLTGVINNTERPVFFSSQERDFRFCFMTDSVHSFGVRNDSVKVSNVDGFIFGRTHDNHIIAIYSGDDDLNIIGAFMLNAGAYAVSNGNVNPGDFNTFNAISFSGGSLNRVFRIDGISINYTFEDGLLGRLNDDSKVFDLLFEDSKIHIDIHSKVFLSDGQDGKTINNSGVTLTLSFDKEQPLRLMFKYYDIVKRVISFMSFRTNVGFEEVELLKKTDEYNTPVPFAKVYMRDNQELASKDYQRNITAEDLGEAFPKLISLFYETGEKPMAPLIGFLPENEKNLYCITNSKLREICSSIEKELEFISDIKVEENKQIEELKIQVKNTVKAYRNGHLDFPEGALNLVNNSINAWSLSLRERIIALCDKYKTEILLMNQFDVVLDSEAVRTLVKYRNTITHGNTGVMTAVVAETAFVLSGVVYFCVLDRIGVPRLKIQELAKNKLLR